MLFPRKNVISLVFLLSEQGHLCLQFLLAGDVLGMWKVSEGQCWVCWEGACYQCHCPAHRPRSEAQAPELPALLSARGGGAHRCAVPPAFSAQPGSPGSAAPPCQAQLELAPHAEENPACYKGLLGSWGPHPHAIPPPSPPGCAVLIHSACSLDCGDLLVGVNLLSKASHLVRVRPPSCRS